MMKINDIKRIHYRNKGLTLVELLLAISIFGIVMVLVSTMLIQTYDIFGGTSERLTRKQMAEIRLEEIADAIRGNESYSLGDNEDVDDLNNNEYKIMISFEDDEGNEETREKTVRRRVEVEND